MTINTITTACVTGYTDDVTSTDPLTTTSTLFGLSAVLKAARQPDSVQPPQQSADSIKKTYLNCNKMQNNSGVVMSENFSFPGYEVFELQNVDEFKTPRLQQSVNTKKSRYAAAIALLEKWVVEDLGDDEKVWKRLKYRIEESRISTRKRYRD